MISGAAGDGPERLAASARFTAFFTAHAVPHFRCEEEGLFPLVASPPGEEPPEALVRALLDHSRLHALAGAIRDAVERGDVDGELLIAAGHLLRDHVRLEERTLFPLIEERAGDAGLAAIALHAAGRGLRAEEPVVAALEQGEGRGVVWSASSADLNVNLVDWPAGEGVAAHVNTERDVLFVVIAGTGEVVLDGHGYAVKAHSAVLVPAGTERSLRAGDDGIRYVSVHLRRPSGFSIG